MNHSLSVLPHCKPAALSANQFDFAGRVVSPCRNAFVGFTIAATLIVGTARGAIISQYSFDGATLNRSATTVAANVTAGDIADAPVVNGNPTVVLVRTTGVGYATQPLLSVARANFNESSVRDDVYFTFDVAPEAGFTLDLSSLTFNVAQGGGTAMQRDYDIRTSLDGFTSSLTGVVPIPTVRPTFTPFWVAFPGPSFQGLTSPVTFQVRIFSPGVLQNIDFDDITLNGEIVAIPEPATVLALAVLGCSILGFRLPRRQMERRIASEIQ